MAGECTGAGGRARAVRRADCVMSSMASATHGRTAAGFLVVGLLIIVGAAAFVTIQRIGPSKVFGTMGAGERGTIAPESGSAPPGGIADAETLQAVIDSAMTLVQQGEVSRAESVLAAAVREHPGDGELRLAHARTLVELKRPSEAYAAYEAAIATGATGADVQFEAGTVANMAGRAERAVEHFSEAQRAAPTNAEYSLYLAQVQRKLGERSAARKNLLLATRSDDSLSIAWGTLADMELEDNRAGVALQYIAKARELEPREPVWRLIEARALKRQNEPGRALMVLEGIDGDDRYSLPVLRLVGECFALLGRPDDASARFVEAAERPGAAPEVLFETAIWCERAEDGDAAIKWARFAAMQGHEEAAALVRRLEGE